MKWSRVLAAMHTTAAALIFGLGFAIGIWLVLIAAVVLLALGFALFLLAIVPVLLIGIGLKLWPGGGLRLTDPEGTAVTLFEAIAGGIRKARDERRFLRGLKHRAN